MINDIWIVDFGSQYTQLITRRVRELGFRSHIISFEQFEESRAKGDKPRALILSGGPNSVYEDGSDYASLFTRADLPILGLCYGMQIMAHHFGAVVTKGLQGEYGQAEVYALDAQKSWPTSFKAWMSHGDHVANIPEGFEALFKSAHGLWAGMIHKKNPWLGLQFHPEVEHTERGRDILRQFLEKVAKLKADWSGENMLDESLNLIRHENPGAILCAFSGGVDSLVAATLCHKIFPERLHCFFVDHGLVRPQDHHHLKLLSEKSGLSINTIEASDLFLGKLKGVSDPEEKRKIIGHTFIEVFENQIHQYEKSHGVKFTHLLQGTLYPDVIESHNPRKKNGRSVTIKSHHNVGGLPERMKLQLLEPLRWLFKDEVRSLGESLSLPHSWLHRHPFPGPGIGVRVLGELTPTRVAQVQQSDQILFEELQVHRLYQSCWQAFTVLLPVKTVGVKGDGRAYEEVICLRIVNSSDGMTADWTEMPYHFLATVSRRITNEVRGITRVVYDITSKPPGTIEWE